MNNKKKLMVIVGAGASIQLGMPSVSKIDEFFCNWSKDYFTLENNKEKTLYDYIKEEINNYYSQRAIQSQETNFEEMLYTILQLEGFLGNVFSNALSALTTVKSLPEINYLGGITTPTGSHLNHLARTLLDKLVDDFRDRCANTKTNQSEEFGHFSGFINSLVDEFDVAFISLNYDNLITQACPSLFTGFDKETGEFDPVSIHKRADFNLIYHLHGSIHFDYKDSQIYWNKSPSLGARHSQSRITTPNLEGINQPKSTIIAGYGKTNQIQAVPFRTYYSKIDSIADQADAFLFLGYGFNDPHINNSLYSLRKERNKPVVVIDWADDRSQPLLHQTYNKGSWAGRLNNTVSFNKHEMRMENLEHVPPSISTLKKMKIFDVSINKNYPLAVWYDGFIEACKNYEKVSEKLRSN